MTDDEYRQLQKLLADLSSALFSNTRTDSQAHLALANNISTIANCISEMVTRLQRLETIEAQRSLRELDALMLFIPLDGYRH